MHETYISIIYNTKRWQGRITTEIYCPTRNTVSFPLKIWHTNIGCQHMCATLTHTYTDMPRSDKGFLCTASYGHRRAPFWALGQLGTGQLWSKGAMSGFNAGSPAEGSAHANKTIQLPDWNLFIFLWLEGKKEHGNGLTRSLCQCPGKGQFGTAFPILSGDTTCLEGKNWGESSALLQTS